jgi:hypothetical protein
MNPLELLVLTATSRVLSPAVVFTRDVPLPADKQPRATPTA